MDKLRYFPHFLLFSYLIRTLIFGASFGDALVMVVFGAIYTAHLYLDHIKEPEVNKDIKDKIAAIEETQNHIKSKVSNLTLGGSLRK